MRLSRLGNIAQGEGEEGDLVDEGDISGSFWDQNWGGGLVKFHGFEVGQLGFGEREDVPNVLGRIQLEGVEVECMAT